MVKAYAAQPALARWVDTLYKRSGIETRYTCLPDGTITPVESRYAPLHDPAAVPGTAERMLTYEREATAIGVAAARNALADACTPAHPTPEAVAESITHLIVVSCTGFFAPGLDQQVAQQLGLRPTVERTIVGFMGCAAAFNALRLANAIVRGQPDARVLIVCAELCSIHIQPGSDRLNIIVAALFCDGAAACIVGQPDAAQQHDWFALANFHTHLKPETESFMVWRIGDTGFTLQLSAQVPDSLAEVAPDGLQTLLGTPDPDLAFWAIHPGGKAILDRLESVLHLDSDATGASRTVLRDYGNMSSPTILFVLDEHRRRLRVAAPANDGTPQPGVAMAFGPGLVTEMAHMVYCTGERATMEVGVAWLE